MRIIAFLVFIVLQIQFIPLAILGVLMVGYRQMVVSKRLGVSQTGIEVLNGRWTMHVFEIRKDLAAARLAESMPNTSTFGLWLCLFPLWVYYKISGAYLGYPKAPEAGAEGIKDIVTARTLYFDRIIDRVLGGMDQFVILGAGYDTRAYGELKREGLAFFELDQPVTQNLKVESLRSARLDGSHVTFVSVDFSQENAFDKLLSSGYDPDKKTLFLWEGVTLYLNEAEVRKTLHAIRENATRGSVVVADFYAERMIRAYSGSAGRKALELTDETLGFGLPFATDFEKVMKDFVEGEGMKQGESHFMGYKSPKGPFMVVTEICV